MEGGGWCPSRENGRCRVLTPGRSGRQLALGKASTGAGVSSCPMRGRGAEAATICLPGRGFACRILQPAGPQGERSPVRQAGPCSRGTKSRGVQTITVHVIMCKNEG